MLGPLTASMEFPFRVSEEGRRRLAIVRKNSNRELVQEKHVSPTWWLSNLTLPTSCQRVEGATLRASSDGRKHWVKQQLANKQGGTRQ